MGSVSSQIAPRPRAYWLLQGIPPLLLFLSGIPNDDSFWGDIEPEAADKVNSIFKDRERALAAQKLIVSVASRTQDILPASSLQAGITRSLAVCRIARYFSLKSLQEFIEYIEAIIKQQGDNNNFDSVDKLKEIFLIPGSVANEIFKKLEFSTEVQESVRFLESLKNISESQLSKLNPIPVGTGFLVGGTYLLTNCHVIPDKKMVEQCVAQFNYAEDEQGYTKTSVDYEFDSETLFIPEPALDYTLVQLKTSLFTQQPGYKYDWIQLIEDDENILPRDGIFVIHHPKGQPKKIDLSNNEVIANGLYKNFLRYQADTDYGSSGSPIFNNKWELVALHHAVVPKNINQEYDQPQLESKHNPAQEKSVVSTNVKDKKEDAQQGIRICRIIEDLKKKSFSNQKLASFIEDFVITSEQLNYPPLPAALEFDGKRSYVSMDGAIALASVVKNYEYVESTIKAGSTIKLWSRGGVELRNFQFAGILTDICFSPNDEAIAFGLDNTIQLWSLDGKELQTFKGHEDLVIGVSFSPDGKMLASGSRDNTIKLWSLDGKELQTFKGHEDYVISVSFSPDGKMLASGSRDNTIKLWSLDGNELQTFKGHEYAVRRVSFSPDSKMLASGSWDGTVKLWSLDGKEVQTFKGHKSDVIAVSFSPDSKMLASADADVTVKLWSVDGGEPKTLERHKVIWERESIWDVSFSPDGKTIAAINSKGIVQIWSLEEVWPTILGNPEIRGNPDISRSAETRVSFNPQNSYEATVDDLSSLRNSKSITIEAWVNPYLNGGVILSNARDWVEGKSGEFTLKFLPDGYLAFSVCGGPLPNCYQAISKEQLMSNKFSHIAITYDGKEIKIYINGQENTDTNHYYILNNKDLTRLDLPHTVVNASVNLTAPVLIGAALRQDSSVRLQTDVGESSQVKSQVLDSFFKGAIAEIRLWNIVRSQAQLQANMYRRLNGDEEGLISYWQFNENKSDKVYNLSSKRSDYGLVCEAKKLNASQVYFLPLPCGLKFNGESDRVDCGNDESLDVAEAITIEVWVKHKFGNCLIVSRRGNGESGYSLSWYNRKIRVVLQGENSGEKTVVDIKDNAPQDQVWHHVALTWDKASEEISIFIDGRLQNSVVVEGQYKTIIAEGQTQSFGLFTGSIARLTGNLMIGRKEDKETYYNVAIAEVRLWKVSRPQDKIKANMSRRLKGNEKGLVGYWRLDDGGEGNNHVRNLVSGTMGTVYGATWFPVREIADTGNKGDSTDNPPEAPLLIQ